MTGYPIAEAYWTNVNVAGTPHLVLLQCFERRCLTYTPDNAPGWQVEAGNVGQHYYRWRHGEPNPTEDVSIYLVAIVTMAPPASRSAAVIASYRSPSRSRRPARCKNASRARWSTCSACTTATTASPA